MAFNNASGWEVVFFETARGEAPVEVFLNDLSPQARAKCAGVLGMLKSLGTQLSFPLCRKVTEELWELRVIFGGVQHRFFYSFEGDVIVVLHAVKKKSRKLALRDLQTARNRLRAFREATSS